MSDLFGNYKRPRAEKKVIEKFVKKYEKAKTLFKSQNYVESLNEFNIAYDLLSDIWDIFPKIVTLYTMMKGYFYTKQYDDCKNIMEILEPMLEYLPKNKFDLFIKMKSKIMVYQLTLYFMYDELDNAFDAVIDMIKYLSNSTIFTLEQKTKFFWKYIKGFLKITGISKGNKFQILKEGFDSMIVEQILLNNDDQSNKNDLPATKKINRNMIEIYKNFMNSKLRGIIYEILDKEFFEIKYHKKNDKVMLYLHKNMDIFIRDNNKDKLMENFHTFLVLNKMNLKKEYNMTLSQLVFEQKRRIEMFDKIFSNLVGSFNNIFKHDFAMALPNITKTIKKKRFAQNSFQYNINQLRNMIKVKLNSPLRWRKRKSILKNGEEEEENKNINNEIETNKNIERKISYDYTFIKEIKIPPNTEEMDKQILYDNFITRRNLLNKAFNKRMNTLNTINNYKAISRNITDNRTNKTKTIIPKYNENNLEIKLPTLTLQNNNETKEEEKEKDMLKIIHKKKSKNKINKEIKTDINESENDTMRIKHKNVFKLRNINNYFITKILNIFSAFNHNVHSLHDSQPEEYLDNIHVHIRRKDLFDFNHTNFIKSYNIISVKGNQFENQDNYFFYENYFLVKNLYFFGVLDGHGKNGKEISKYASILFPSYLFYLLLDDNLSERKLDINKEIIKLIKIQESPLNIKQMFILTYFFNKFEVDFSTIPLFSNNQQKLNHIILESIDYSQNALSSKYDIDISLSGTTLCSALIIGNILYIINIGDSRAILGTYNSRINKWKITQLSVDHKPNHPNENRRIIVYNGRIERHKNEFGDEVGPYRIYGKDSDSNGQGLTMSRSIGDLESKKYGVIYDPDVFKYELKENDKVIVIGSDGLWEQLKNEEVIEIIGECLNKDLKAKEASEILVEKARKKFLDEYKRKNKKYNYEHNLSDNYYHFNNDKNHEINSDKTNYKNSYIDDITCIVVFLDVEDKK